MLLEMMHNHRSTIPALSTFSQHSEVEVDGSNLPIDDGRCGMMKKLLFLELHWPENSFMQTTGAGSPNEDNIRP
jgi:hypothetical protein